MKKTIPILLCAIALLDPAVGPGSTCLGDETAQTSDSDVPGRVAPLTDERENVLVNPGFESGTLDPWTGNWFVTDEWAAGGSYCAITSGNHSLTQTFAPVDVTSIAAFTLYTMQLGGPGIQHVDFIMDEGDFGVTFFFEPGTWTFHDLTQSLPSSGNLRGIRIWGCYYEGCTDLTLVDDVVISVGPTPVRESSWGRLKAIYR